MAVLCQGYLYIVGSRGRQESIYVLSRQMIDLSRPHPFTLDGQADVVVLMSFEAVEQENESEILPGRKLLRYLHGHAHQDLAGGGVAQVIPVTTLGTWAAKASAGASSE